MFRGGISVKKYIVILLCFIMCMGSGCGEKYAERASWDERNYETVELKDTSRYLTTVDIDKAACLLYNVSNMVFCHKSERSIPL